MSAPTFPAGTPEYEAYRAELQMELAKFAAGDPPYEYSKDPLVTGDPWPEADPVERLRNSALDDAFGPA